MMFFLIVNVANQLIKLGRGHRKISVSGLPVEVFILCSLFFNPDGRFLFGDFKEAGAHISQYQVLAHFNNPDFHRYEIDQLVDFIAMPVEGIWYFLGVRGRDNHLNKATDTVSWADVLSLYR